ncbi:hypothetical protein [Calditerrivibrio nitroreducens]|uniref:hypothetical protein n=1 Tax=Calditerrivibrio nitroreducens TaxID=477976 RepID=UPI000314390A|nr:hypothetical protein [Calditerrivibrio nitroreducens]
MIDELIGKEEYFNSEGGVGSFSEGYSVSDIEKTLKKFDVWNFKDVFQVFVNSCSNFT